MDKEKSFTSTSINWYPGHMVKAKRLILEDLKLIDLVIEVLDARIPLSSQNPEIKEITKGKKRIVVLNKSDLADQEENKKWVKYFESQNIKAIIVNANTGFGINNVIRETKNLMKDDLRQAYEKGRKGKSIRVLVLGIPNVGKSSFINRVAMKKSAEVGNKPGVTKKNKWIRVDDGIELLDTPGVLWPKFESEEVALNLSYTGTIKDEILDITEISINLVKLLSQRYPELLAKRYKLDLEEMLKTLHNEENINNNIYNIIKMIAIKRGALISGGRIDDEKISRIIVDDFRSGKIGNISLEVCKKYQN